MGRGEKIDVIRWSLTQLLYHNMRIIPRTVDEVRLMNRISLNSFGPLKINSILAIW